MLDFDIFLKYFSQQFVVDDHVDLVGEAVVVKTF